MTARTLNDFFPTGPIEIWYYKPEEQRDFGMGSSWLNRQKKMPTVATVSATHIKLGSVEYPVGTSPEYPRETLARLFTKLQGEKWSPNGEAAELIESLALWHTSMSVGDIVHLSDLKEWFMVDNIGFVRLKEK